MGQAGRRRVRPDAVRQLDKTRVLSLQEVTSKPKAGQAAKPKPRPPAVRRESWSATESKAMNIRGSHGLQAVAACHTATQEHTNETGKNRLALLAR